MHGYQIAKELHLHPGHVSLELARRQFVELHEIGRQFLDDAEDAPEQGCS